MMSKVIKPDYTEVTFKYDSLGRRIEKRSDEKVMNFVWDGNTILHEYFQPIDSEKSEKLVEYSSQNNLGIPENLVTWVFNDGFVPSAKITSEGNYSIISDYLGTPVEAYDEEDNKVWSAELDIYGCVEEFTGEKDFIPFRYQGQYDDIEIGLYYNRFRYYEPEQGNYTQQDPIGLAGGNPTLYVYDPLTEFDLIGFKPTKFEDRLFLKELLGPFAKKGGVYFFPEGDRMYVGKAKNLYKRLYQHLNKEKLIPANLDKIGFIHDPNALTCKDLFKLEDNVIKKFRLKKFNPDGIELSNKINSPGRNMKNSTKCKP